MVLDWESSKSMLHIYQLAIEKLRGPQFFLVVGNIPRDVWPRTTPARVHTRALGAALHGQEDVVNKALLSPCRLLSPAGPPTKGGVNDRVFQRYLDLSVISKIMNFVFVTEMGRETWIIWEWLGGVE